MAVKIRNIDAAIKKLNKSIDEFATNSKVQEDIAKKMQLEYRKNIREGFGVDGGALPALSEKTKQNRARLKQAKNKTSKSFSAGKSNLTITGEFVQNIFIKFLSYSRKRMRFELTFEGEHQPYKTLSGKSKAKVSNNSDIARGMKDLGYKIFGFPVNKIPEVAKNVSILFKRYLKKK